MTTITKFRNKTTGQTVEIKADFAQASSPIEVCYDGGKWQMTNYQVADARHDTRQALVLVLGWEG
jgi:hypothetical protein